MWKSQSHYFTLWAHNSVLNRNFCGSIFCASVTVICGLTTAPAPPSHTAPDANTWLTLVHLTPIRYKQSRGHVTLCCITLYLHIRKLETIWNWKLYEMETKQNCIIMRSAACGQSIMLRWPGVGTGSKLELRCALWSLESHFLITVKHHPAVTATNHCPARVASTVHDSSVC